MELRDVEQFLNGCSDYEFNVICEICKKEIRKRYLTYNAMEFMNALVKTMTCYEDSGVNPRNVSLAEAMKLIKRFIKEGRN